MSGGALRRLHALEVQLAGRVQEDITALRQQWVQQRVDRVTNNTYKLYQVRENLKLSKVIIKCIYAMFLQ